MIDIELFRKYFQYSSPSDMYKNLNKTISLKENKAQVNTIKDGLAKLMEAIKRSPTNDAKKLETKKTCRKLSNVFLRLIN